jgi:Zn-ribbon-containing, possibly RNA-binding protein and truncated derivatives
MPCAGPGTPSATGSCRVSPDSSPVRRDPARTDGDQRAPASPPSSDELAQAVLEAARVRRESRPPTQRRTASGERRLRGYSGPGPDPRDPAPLGELIARLVKLRGWQRPAAEARIFGTWDQIVGADLAAHCRPVKLADGELTIEAESTAWATQIRLLSRPLLSRIQAEVGRDVVRRIHVHGPVAPSWGRGPKRVRGRGPRDTYG